MDGLHVVLDDGIRDLQRLLNELLPPLGFLFFLGDVLHDADQKVRLFFHNDGVFHVSAVLAEVFLLHVDLVALQRVEVVEGVEVRSHLGADCIGRADGTEDAAHRLVDQADIQIGVEDHQAAGEVLHDFVGEGFGLLHEVGQAHLDPRVSFDDGGSLLFAAAVAAAAAVQAGSGVFLAHLLQHVLNRLSRRLRAGTAFRRVDLADICPAGAEAFKIFRTGEAVHRDRGRHDAELPLRHEGTVHAASLAGGHFDKAVVKLSFPDILQGLHGIPHPVADQVVEITVFAFHGLQNAAVGGKEARPGFFGQFLFPGGLHGDSLRCEPFVQLPEGQRGLHDLVVLVGLVLLCDAGADEDDLGFLAVPELDVLSVGQHGGQDVRQIRKAFGIVALDQKVDGMAAGGDDDVPALLQHFIVGFFDDGGADGRFLHVEKAELLQGVLHAADVGVRITGDEARRQGDDHLVVVPDEAPDLFGVVTDHLQVLRTDVIAFSAENAVFLDDLGLVLPEGDGLDGAVADALVAVSAVFGVAGQTILHNWPSFL